MTDADMKVAIEKFLKNVSFTAQREIEKSLRAAIADGKVKSGEPLNAAVTVASEKLGLNVTVHRKIEI